MPIGFKWNGVHTTSIDVIAEANPLPVKPEPRIVTEEVPGRDGFYDFSGFSANGREAYRPRIWTFHCAFHHPPRNIKKHVADLLNLFASYRGCLEADQCPGVRWRGVITNGIDLAGVAATAKTFNIYIQTQAFAEGLEGVTVTHNVAGGGAVAVVNPGTWFVRPDVYLTGVAGNAVIGGVPVFGQGALDNALAWGPELAPGDNAVEVTGFTGEVRFEFVPRYVWGA